MSTLSPNMNLPISTVGVDSGLLWEQNLNASLSILDQHNHTSGSGAQIPPSGLNINAALTFNNNQATNLQAAVFTPQVSLATLNSFYFIGVDAYINDGAGNVVRVTSGGAVNATSSGISSGTATASFVGSTLVVNADSNKPANIQAGSILIGNNVTSSNFATVSVPNALGANYPIILPLTPAATSFLQMDTSGNITGSIHVSGGLTTSNLSSSAGIVGGQLAASTITEANVVPLTLTTASIAIGTILGSNIAPTTVAASNLVASTTITGSTVSGNTTPGGTVITSSISSGYVPTVNRPLYIIFGGYFNINAASSTPMNIAINSGLVTIINQPFTIAAANNNITMPFAMFNTTVLANNVGATHTLSATISNASGANIVVTNFVVAVSY